jgi:hypothetical protein
LAGLYLQTLGGFALASGVLASFAARQAAAASAPIITLVANAAGEVR